MENNFSILLSFFLTSMAFSDLLMWQMKGFGECSSGMKSLIKTCINKQSNSTSVSQVQQDLNLLVSFSADIRATVDPTIIMENLEEADLLRSIMLATCL